MVVPPTPSPLSTVSAPPILLSVRPHPVEAPAAFGVAVGKTHSVVRDGEPDPVGLEAQTDLDSPRPGVQEGVGQRVVRDGEETSAGFRGERGLGPRLRHPGRDARDPLECRRSGTTGTRPVPCPPGCGPRRWGPSPPTWPTLTAQTLHPERPPAPRSTRQPIPEPGECPGQSCRRSEPSCRGSSGRARCVPAAAPAPSSPRSAT